MAFLVPLAVGSAAAGGAAATAGLFGSAGALTLGGALSGIGTVTSALGALKSSRAAASADKYNAAVATNNANISRQNADHAAQEGNIAVAKQQQEDRAKAGAIKAAQGASGVDVNSGSSIDVRSSAAQTGQLNAISLRSAAARKAYGYQTEASNYDAQAGLDTASAKNEKSAGLINAGTTLLSGAGDAYNSYKSSGSL